MMMKLQRKLLTAGALAAVLALAGCWGDDDDESGTAPVVTEVPASAGVSSASFVNYLLSLAGNDETSEPLTITDTFAVPADESSEPAPLT